MCRFKSGLIFKDRVVLAPMYNESHSRMLERMEIEDSDFNARKVYMLAIIPCKNLPFKYGFIDKDGQEVIAFKYCKARSFHEGLAYVRTKNNIGFINKNGEQLISYDYKYYFLKDFHEGRAAIKDKRKNKCGFINKNGEIVVPCIYDLVFSFHEGFAFVVNNSRCFFIDREGKELEFKDLKDKEETLYVQNVQDIPSEYFNPEILEYVSAFKADSSEIVFVSESDYNKYLESLISVYKAIQLQEESEFFEDILDKQFVKKIKR